MIRRHSKHRKYLTRNGKVILAVFLFALGMIIGGLIK